MSLSADEKQLLREAIYVARLGAPRDLDDALRILNEQVLEDTYQYSLIGAANIDLAQSRSPEYERAWDSLRRELRVAPPVVVPSTPEPEEHPDAYPHPPVEEYTPDEFAAAVLRVLADKGLHVRQNKLSIGMLPDEEDAAGLQIGGDAAAVILGVSNTRGTDAQNPGEVHKNTFVVADNDGGMRWRQYLQWVTSGKKRNTLNRPASILALDSYGNHCQSMEPVGATADKGQAWYIITDTVNKKVMFCTFKQGWTVEVYESLADYASLDVRKL